MESVVYFIHIKGAKLIDKHIKVKLTDISNKDSGFSSFSLAYSGRKIENAEISYQIISTLKAKTFLYLELNSSLLSSEVHDKEGLAEMFTEKLQDFGLQFIRKKKIENEKRRILSVSLEGRKVHGFEIYALIPHEIWCDEAFKKILPQFGIRYYLPLETLMDNLQAFVDLDEEERLEISRMVIFDNVKFTSMGINSVHMIKDEINSLLT